MVLRCKQCGKIFKDKSNMRRHVKMHLQIKNYQCSICSNTFIQSTNCMTHIVEHHLSEVENLNKKKRLAKKLMFSIPMTILQHLYIDESYECLEDTKKDDNPISKIVDSHFMSSLFWNDYYLNNLLIIE